MRWITILFAFGLIASLALAQTAPVVGDPLRAAVTNAALPATAAKTQPISASTSEKQQASIARQREAVRKQAEDVGVWLIPGRRVDAAEPAEQPTLLTNAEKPSSKVACDPIGEESVTPIIDVAAKMHSVHPKLLRAVIEQESRFHPCAVSPKGAKGLMQLMPDTAAELGVHDPFDPKENIEAGAKYLRQMLDKYKGDVAQALGAYNAGPAAVDQSGGVPNFRETREYVQSIMEKVGTIPIDLPNIPMPKPIEN